MRMGGGSATRIVAEHGGAVHIRLRADRGRPAESALENDDHGKARRPDGVAWPDMDNHGDDNLQAAQAPALPAGGVLNNATFTVPKGTPRKQIIVEAVAKALEDALPSLPAENVAVRRMVLSFVLEFREGRLVVVDADVTINKPRAITITTEE